MTVASKTMMAVATESTRVGDICGLDYGDGVGFAATMYGLWFIAVNEACDGTTGA